MAYRKTTPKATRKTATKAFVNLVDASMKVGAASLASKSTHSSNSSKKLSDYEQHKITEQQLDRQAESEAKRLIEKGESPSKADMKAGWVFLTISVVLFYFLCNTDSTLAKLLLAAASFFFLIFAIVCFRSQSRLNEKYKEQMLKYERELKRQEREKEAYNNSVDNTLKTMAYKTLTTKTPNAISEIDVCISNTPQNKVKKSLVLALEDAIEFFASDDSIDNEEEELIEKYMEKYNINQYDYVNVNKYETLVKLLVIKDLLNGVVSQRFLIDNNSTIGINLQKGESIIWAFQNVDFSEYTTNSHYQGISQGFSIKVAQGVYYKTGGFKGERVSQSSMKYKATGVVYVTNKHIYFYSMEKSFKIPYTKIVAYTPYQDGLGVQKEGVSAKPMIFTNIDGWYIYNLVQNIRNC